MLWQARWAAALFASVAVAACGTSEGFDTAPVDATLDIPDGRVQFEAGADVPLPGRVCDRSAQCDDGIPCTDDLCGSDNRCVNLPNSSRCDDGVYCNGAEICDLRRGCIRGAPVNCNDNNVCTSDRCVEATRECRHAPLDRDGDGDPDDHCQARECGDAGVPEPDAGVPTPCWRGHDCNDSDPRVSSLAPEICGDGIDNNCNGHVDTAEPGGCRRAAHDRCDDPLDVSTGGVFTLDVGASMADYALPCASGVGHDVVARFRLTEPRDIDIEARSPGSVVAVALQTACGGTAPGDTLDCDFGFPGRVRRHSLPAGDYFLVVGASGTDPVDLTVVFTPATPTPGNDTCATPVEIPPEGATYRSDLVGLGDDVSTACGGSARDAVYAFTLTEPRDVTLQLAGARRDFLHLALAASCARAPAVLRCDSGSTVSFTAHELPAGTYYAFVESFDPVSYTLQATFGPPTPPAAGDTCANPLALTTAAPVPVSAAFMENDYGLSCSRTGRDTVLRFELAERRDVLVSARGGRGDFLAVALQTRCGDAASERTCVTGGAPRAFGIGLDPGTYYAVVKPFRPADYQVTLETFPPLAVTNVSDNDTCDRAFAIPPGRGYFRGSTAPLAHQYNSPCAGATAGKDAVFALHLDARQRVTVVTETPFFHSVWITRQDRCPGTSPSSTACTLGTRTTLDEVLDAGDYYIILDGLAAGYEGDYGLLVHLGPAT